MRVAACRAGDLDIEAFALWGEQVQGIAGTVEDGAAAIRRPVGSRERQGWRDWSDEALERNARRMHKASRVHSCWVPIVVHDQGRIASDPAGVWEIADTGGFLEGGRNCY